MKQRLLVMNHSKVVQVEENGEWKNSRIEKAGTLKPGIYNIYNATTADKSSKYNGAVVHIDKDQLYQKVSSSYISHDINNIDLLPKIGSNKCISYSSNGKPVITASEKLSYSNSL